MSPIMFMLCTEIYSNSFYFHFTNVHVVPIVCMAVCKVLHENTKMSSDIVTSLGCSQLFTTCLHRLNYITETTRLSKGLGALWMHKGDGSHIWSGDRKLLPSIGRILLGKHCWLKVFQSEGTYRKKSMESVPVGDSTCFNSEYPGCVRENEGRVRRQNWAWCAMESPQDLTE